MRTKISNWLQSKKGVKFSFFSLLILFSLLLFAIQYTSVRQKRLDIKEGQLASETIRAPKTVENITETEAKKTVAEESVVAEYTYQSDLEEQQQTRIENLLTLVNQVTKDAEDKYQSDSKKAGTTDAVSKPTVEDKIALLKSKFETFEADDIDFYQSLPSSFYEKIFAIETSEVTKVKEVTVTLLKNAMTQRIREEGLDDVTEEAKSSLDDADLTADGKELAADLLDVGIVANEIYNEKKTEELKKAAREAVSPVMIYTGEIIVREGVQVDAKAIQKLQLLGLLGAETSRFPMIALACLIVLQAVMLVALLKQETPPGKRLGKLLFYACLMLMSVLIMKFLQFFQTNALSYTPLVFPAAFAPLVLNLFISRRAGIMATLFQVAFALFVYYDSVGTSNMIAIVVLYFFSGSLANLMPRKRIASQVKTASLWLVIYPLSFTLIFEIYQGMSFSTQAGWITLACSLVGYALTFFMSIGLHPYIEWILNDDSIMVLNELSNPNHPLLKQLLEEAPGTYHHSMMVANLSANAVAEIGGRSLITRVACYYHDIGKIKHANFFVENLPAGAENPHNFLLPEDSKEIIFGHVTDGAKILEDAKMPKLVIDICRQHHGTTLMRFFYVKAKERDDSVTEADYRYPGPKPQTKEAAVVSIADTCEAAVRAMDHPTNAKIKEFVHDVIQGRLKDGQLSECDLTLRELAIVEKSLVNGLCSTFHSRIKYPKMEKEAVQMKEEQERRN